MIFYDWWFYYKVLHLLIYITSLQKPLSIYHRFNKIMINTWNPLQSKGLWLALKPLKHHAMNKTFLALHSPLLKMQILWPKNWTKLGYAQQAPKAHSWLVSSHSTTVPLIFTNIPLYITLYFLTVSAICFSCLCFSSNNASVVGPTTLCSIYASLFFNSLIL